MIASLSVSAIMFVRRQVRSRFSGLKFPSGSGFPSNATLV
jgi:hypothetical protein